MIGTRVDVFCVPGPRAYPLRSGIIGLTMETWKGGGGYGSEYLRKELTIRVGPPVQVDHCSGHPSSPPPAPSVAFSFRDFLAHGFFSSQVRTLGQKEVVQALLSESRHIWSSVPV
jgi:hypothetical protein